MKSLSLSLKGLYPTLPTGIPCPLSPFPCNKPYLQPKCALVSLPFLLFHRVTNDPWLHWRTLKNSSKNFLRINPRKSPRKLHWLIHGEILKNNCEKSRKQNWNYLLTSISNEVYYLNSLKGSVWSWIYLNFSWIFNNFRKKCCLFSYIWHASISFFIAASGVLNKIVFSCTQ